MKSSPEQLALPFDETSASTRRLYLGGSLEAVWEEIVRPWLERAGAAAWRREAPSLVVVPFRSDAYFWKSRLLEAEIATLGVRFVTPSELRETLARHLQVRANVPAREHLRLLLIALVEDKASQREIDPVTAKALANAPDHLLQAWAELNTSGTRFDSCAPAEFQRLIADFERLVHQCEFDVVHELDRQLLAQSRRATPVLADVLLIGFNGMHWPFWPLLQAGCRAAAEASIWFAHPRDEAGDLDEAWIGTWEETFGSARPVNEAAVERPRPLAELGGSVGSTANGAVHFVIGKNSFEQAQAITTAALYFLAGGKTCAGGPSAEKAPCRRLGIFFPGPGALARHVSALLCAKNVPHNDGLAHIAPGPLEHTAWPLWLALLNQPRLSSLLPFLRAFGQTERFFGPISLEQVESDLRHQHDQILIDDLAVLAEAFARAGTPTSARYAAGLRGLAFLPERGTLAEFVRATETSFRALGWDAHFQQVEEGSRPWRDSLALPFVRGAYLHWLRDTVDSRRPQRDVPGNHPYSRVHLLSYAQGEAQQWSHVIFADLNEGKWPVAPVEGGYLGDDEISNLNQRILSAKKRNLQQGRQGAGHVTVGPNQTLCLGSAEKQRLALRCFLNIAESVEQEIFATASLYEESAPSRFYNFSEFFNRLHFHARGQSLSGEAALGLQEATERWLDASRLWPRPLLAPSDDVQQTRRAHDARWAETRGFGPYEFSLAGPINREIVLSATDWEYALKYPAVVWLRKYLGVEAWRDSGNWYATSGRWVHRWLGAVSGGAGTNCLAPFPTPAVIFETLHRDSEQLRRDVESLLLATGRQLPDWWVSIWRNAVYTALRFAQELANAGDWARLGTEWKLHPTVAIELAKGALLRLRGHIDVILARGEATAEAGPFANDEVMIIDYKTGHRKALAPKSTVPPEVRAAKICAKLRIGNGLQIALYGLALKQLGARRVGMSFVSLNLPLAGADLHLEDLDAQERLWFELHRMQESGVFGMHGELRPDYGYGGDYPLATLEVDPELLDEKWAAAHPGLMEECEDDEEET